VGERGRWEREEDGRERKMGERVLGKVSGEKGVMRRRERERRGWERGRGRGRMR